MKKTAIFLLTSFAFLTLGCSDPETYKEVGGKGRLAKMTAEERLDIAPNDLFIAVLDGDSQKADMLSEQDPEALSVRNKKDGNTPLGLAIQLRETEIASLLFSKMK